MSSTVPFSRVRKTGVIAPAPKMHVTPSAAVRRTLYLRSVTLALSRLAPRPR